MRPTRRLPKLGRGVFRRLVRLHVVACSVAAPPGTSEDRVVAWLVIEALNLWAEFVRAYYLSGAMGTRTGSGVSVGFKLAPFPDLGSAIRQAIFLTRGTSVTSPTVPRRLEPAWHDKHTVLPLFRRVGASNLAQVQAAFSVPSTFLEYLPTLRNFYAHRCADTYRKAANVAVRLGLSALPTLRPAQIVCSALPARPQSLIIDWLDEMGDVAGLLCA